MKNYYSILILLLLLRGTSGVCAVHTINATNFMFSPDVVNATVGDSIHFILSSNIHDAVEVSLATWNSASDVSSNGGFFVPFGVLDTFIIVNTAKTYYYLCQNHGHTFNMKGQIVVSNPTGVNNLINMPFQLEIFPNPASGALTVQTNMFEGKENEISIFDITGKVLYKENNPSSAQSLDVSGFSSGIYILSIKSDNQFIERKLVVSK